MPEARTAVYGYPSSHGTLLSVVVALRVAKGVLAT